MNFQEQYDTYMQRNETCIRAYFKDEDDDLETLTESIRYSLLAGGKRVRPVLLYAVADLVKLPLVRADVFAAALEFIHTSSLIHDDMPIMDDDDLRRGRPTNHTVYGEAAALLAGNSLTIKAFEIIARYMQTETDVWGANKALWKLAQAAGYQGMMGGQMMDMELSNRDASVEKLIKMNQKKTGALIRFAVLAPVYIAKVEDDFETELSIYADAIGLSFQVKDDLLDIQSDDQTLGKSNSDLAHNKATMATVLGERKAEQLLASSVEKACDAISVFGSQAGFLIQMAQFVMKRKK